MLRVEGFRDLLRLLVYGSFRIKVRENIADNTVGV